MPLQLMMQVPIVQPALQQSSNQQPLYQPLLPLVLLLAMVAQPPSMSRQQAVLHLTQAQAVSQRARELIFSQ